MAGSDFEHVNRLIADATSRTYDRRSILKRALALGLSTPAISVILAACGGDEDEEQDCAAWCRDPAARSVMLSWSRRPHRWARQREPDAESRSVPPFGTQQRPLTGSAAGPRPDRRA